jgi:hypothetical protein
MFSLCSKSLDIGSRLASAPVWDQRLNRRYQASRSTPLGGCIACFGGSAAMSQVGLWPSLLRQPRLAQALNPRGAILRSTERE